MRGRFGLWVALGLTTGCANTQALETEISRLRRELHFVRQDLAKQKKSVDGLERRMTLLSLGQTSPPSAAPLTPSSPPALASRPLASRSVTIDPREPEPEPPPPPPVRRRIGGRKALPVVRLGANAQPKPVDPDEWVDPGAQDDGSPPIMFKMGNEEERLAVDRTVLNRPDPVLERKGPSPTRADVDDPPRPRRRSASRQVVKAQYKEALATLREKKQAKEALRLFDAFLAAHPKSRFSDNAAYWRGECLMAMQKAGEAIVAFDLLIRRHPRSAKVPFALVRKGESLLMLKRKSDAQKAFQQVMNEHPTSEAASTAKGLLAQMTSSP